MAVRRLFDVAFDSSSDEDNVPVRRPRWIRERSQHFDDFDDLDFETRFRLSKESALDVLSQIEDKLEFPTDRNHAVSPMNQLLCALRFYATGSDQLSAADFGGFSKSTAHRIVHRVSGAIASLYKTHIVFPERNNEIMRTQAGFYRIASFPKVIGAIDCTHIKIKSPGGQNAEIFRNRKGYFSLNVQAICNSNLEFLDIVARWPGSSHDSTIFNNCYRRALFEEGRFENSVLVGDSGYACRSYMMTPLDTARTPQEQLYNESQIRTRNPIERTFGIWKRRFPAMALGMQVHWEKTFPIIVATAVLHNILRRAGEGLPRDDPDLNIPAPWDVLMQQGEMGNLVQAEGGRRVHQNHQDRLNLVENYFGRMARNNERAR
ncbi:putative nuclease HARBI1 [Leptopilina boulardi]|uniref:putative nuclease HARBI1 n=1 Tax=Leptopilina boulardi TaxID=63433 RepID=UPI0021F50FE4|nr:putative nuclease HARBI1 [Leptopilina boulardi]XP_051165382.1 putative nuclease HARBI1 [Leptopilina boulardi]